MKKILSVLFLMSVLSNCVFAESMPIENAQQKIVNEKSYASMNFQKAPESVCGKQSISNKGSWFNINVIINGKPIKVNNPTE